MAETIKAGTILFKDGTFLPDALQFESEPCATGWRLVKNLDGYGLDRKIREAGWTFFCIAGEIKSIVFSFEGQKNVRFCDKDLRKLGSSKIDCCPGQSMGLAGEGLLTGTMIQANVTS